MEMQKLQYNAFGGVDLEIYHEELGRWIPFTAAPDSGDEYVDRVWQLAVGRHDIAPFEPPADWRQAFYREFVDAAETQLMTIAGNPTQTEIASWPEKSKIVEKVRSGGDLDPEDLMTISADIKKFGTKELAIQAIALRSKLYKIADASRNDLMQRIQSMINAASYSRRGRISAVFQASVDNLVAQFIHIRSEALSGNTQPLEDAYKAILASVS